MLLCEAGSVRGGDFYVKGTHLSARQHLDLLAWRKINQCQSLFYHRVSTEWNAIFFNMAFQKLQLPADG